MAVVINNFYAKKGTLDYPDAAIPFWGFDNNLGGSSTLPGPLIEAEVDDLVAFRLYNYINEPVSIMFPGQQLVLVSRRPGRPLKLTQPQYLNGRMISYIDYADSNAGNRYVTYIFEAKKPGIYLYQSGTNADKQIQMGLYGALIIKPEGYKNPNHQSYKTAYGPGTDSDYDIESIMVLGEIDSTIHNGVVEGVYYDMSDYKPDYWLINGKTYPGTVSSDSAINCRIGQRVLLRIINAGYETHSIFFGGMAARVIAGDSFPLKTQSVDATYEKTGITVAPGQSFDILVIPTTPGEYFIYDREYAHVLNNDQFPGGMMTKMTVSV